MLFVKILMMFYAVLSFLALRSMIVLASNLLQPFDTHILIPIFLRANRLYVKTLFSFDTELMILFY